MKLCIRKVIVNRKFPLSERFCHPISSDIGASTVLGSQPSSLLSFRSYPCSTKYCIPPTFLQQPVITLHRSIDSTNRLQDDRRDTGPRLRMQICSRISADGHYASKYEGAAGTSDTTRQTVGNMGKQLGNARCLRGVRGKDFGRVETAASASSSV